MSEADGPAAGRRWHQALVLAVTGVSESGRGQQASPEVVTLARQLLARDGAVTLSGHRDDVLRAGGAWPHPVPSELMVGLGYAQFNAALSLLVRELGLEGRGAVGTAAVSPTIEPGLRRLLDDVPPHHGG